MSRRSKTLADYPIRFAQCRDISHAWDYEKWEKHTRLLLCSRCGTRRIESYDPITKRKNPNRQYVYPAGYLVTSVSTLDAAVEARRLLERLVRSKGLSFLTSYHRQAIRKGA